MNLGKQLENVSNVASKQINAINLIHWVLYPFIFGFLISILILMIWNPKFSGTYKYYDCPQSTNNSQIRINDYKKECVLKEGNVAKRNLILILMKPFLLLRSLIIKSSF